MAHAANLRMSALLVVFFVLVAVLGISPQPHAVREHLEKARQAEKDGALQRAAFHLSAVAERLPGRYEVLERAARDALQAGEAQQALDYLQGIPPASLSAGGALLQGDAYRLLGRTSQAERGWQAALALGGPSQGLYQRLWAAHLELGDYPAATLDLQALVGYQPADPRLRFQLGLLTATQDPSQALPILAQAQELDSSLSAKVAVLRRTILAASQKNSPAYSLLAAGRALAALDEWGLAAQAFRRAVQLRPDYAEAWAFLGEALQHSGAGAADDQEGLAALQKALELDPASLSAMALMALYWERQGSFDQAAQALRGAIQHAPDSPALQVELGQVLALGGDLPSALQAHLEAIRLAPDEAEYLGYLVDFSLKYEYQLREYGLPAARNAVILAPQDPAALDRMSQVMLKLGDLDSAQRFLIRALQADPQNLAAHLHLGGLYLLRGDDQSAYNEWSWVRARSAESSTSADLAQRLLQTYFP